MITKQSEKKRYCDRTASENWTLRFYIIFNVGKTSIKNVASDDVLLIGDLYCLRWCANYSSTIEGMVRWGVILENLRSGKAMGRSHLVSFKRWAVVTGQRERTRFMNKKECGQRHRLVSLDAVFRGLKASAQECGAQWGSSQRWRQQGQEPDPGDILCWAWRQSGGNREPLRYSGPSPVAQMVVCLKCKRPRVRSLVQKDPLVKGMATHFSILAWKIPWTEEPGRPQSMWLQRGRHDQVTNIFTFLFSRCFGQESEMIRLCYEKNQSWLKEFKEWIWWEQDWM